MWSVSSERCVHAIIQSLCLILVYVSLQMNSIMVGQEPIIYVYPMYVSLQMSDIMT